MNIPSYHGFTFRMLNNNNPHSSHNLSEAQRRQPYFVSSSSFGKNLGNLEMSNINDSEYTSDKTPTNQRRVLYRRNTNSRGKRARILRSVQETQPTTLVSSTSSSSSSVLSLMDESLLSLPTMEDDLSLLVQTVVQAVDMRKAENIVVLKVSHITSLTEYIILCSGNSRPQNQAIAGAVQQDVRDTFAHKYKVRGNGAPEGSADSGWIILDYGDIMVHVMTPRSRLYFDIEGKWKGKGAKMVDISSFIMPSSNPSSASSSSSMENIGSRGVKQS